MLKNSNYICRILLYITNLDKIDIISYYSILFTLNSSFFLIKGWTWILKIWSFKMTPWLLMVAVKLSLAKVISFCMYTTSSLSILTLKKKKNIRNKSCCTYHLKADLVERHNQSFFIYQMPLNGTFPRRNCFVKDITLVY